MGKNKSKLFIILIVVAVIVIAGVVVVTKLFKHQDKKEKNQTYENGTVVYFNPENGSKCDEGEAISKTGTKTGCMKWYTFNDDGEDKINLLLDHNTTTDVAWNSTGVNTEMLEVKNTLATDTTTWNADFGARIIGVDEIVKTLGITDSEFYKSSDMIYMIFGIASNYTEYKDTDWMNNWFAGTTTYTDEILEKQKNYAWLFNNTYSCTKYGCETEDNIAYGDAKGMLLGYWTSTPVAENNQLVWQVNFSGSIQPNVTNNAISVGIRPAITIDKSLIK